MVSFLSYNLRKLFPRFPHPALPSTLHPASQESHAHSCESASSRCLHSYIYRPKSWRSRSSGGVTGGGVGVSGGVPPGTRRRARAAPDSSPRSPGQRPRTVPTEAKMKTARLPRADGRGEHFEGGGSPPLTRSRPPTDAAPRGPGPLGVGKVCVFGKENSLTVSM